ncbi:MAG TPA: glycosyl hydrolase family 18 protein [Polyangia bacterium]|nr:glycosyl hydrolase family 18 protein [Polyangia bacterium]
MPHVTAGRVFRSGALALACALAACDGGTPPATPAPNGGAVGVAGASGGDAGSASAAAGSMSGGAGAAGGVAEPDASAPDAVSPDASSIAGAGGVTDAGASDTVVTSDGAAPPADGLHAVAYLPNYSGSYTTWAKKLSFQKMTHLNLAFALATSTNQWDMGASDASVKAIVDAAHAAGVKVLPSLGGGGGDQSVLARYNDAASVGPLVDNLDAFVTAHNFDGVDIDIESPENLGAKYSTFVSMVIAKMHPEGKLVTAAVAQYLQGSMSDATLHSFDFINVMIYSSLADTMKQGTYYVSTKKVPKNLVVLGAGFFGDSGDNEYSYAEILKADPTAWSKDTATVGGATVHYEGMATMKQIADVSRTFGGIMVWELSEDTTDDHSLWKVIQGEL